MSKRQVWVVEIHTEHTGWYVDDSYGSEEEAHRAIRLTRSRSLKSFRVVKYVPETP